jgi:hypothetical protein
MKPVGQQPSGKQPACQQPVDQLQAFDFTVPLAPVLSGANQQEVNTSYQQPVPQPNAVAQAEAFLTSMGLGGERAYSNPVGGNNVQDRPCPDPPRPWGSRFIPSRPPTFGVLDRPIPDRPIPDRPSPSPSLMSRLGPRVSSIAGTLSPQPSTPQTRRQLPLHSGFTPPRAAQGGDGWGNFPPSVSRTSGHTSDQESVGQRSVGGTESPSSTKSNEEEIPDIRPWEDLVLSIGTQFDIGQRSPVKSKHRVASLIEDKPQSETRARLPLFTSLASALDYTREEVVQHIPSKGKDPWLRESTLR